MADRRGAGSTAPLAGLLVLCIALSVRAPLTSVSALLAEIDDVYHLGPVGLATLSAVPVLLFGVAAPLAPWLVRRLGLEASIALLLGVLAVTMLIRPVGAVTLLAGAFVVGAAISLLGIVTPQLIRTHLVLRSGLWTGVYTSVFGVSAAWGAAFAVPLFHLLADEVRWSLAAWAIPVALAALAAVLSLRPLRSRVSDRGFDDDRMRPGGLEPLLRTPGIGAVTAFFGCQALLYFTLAAWLPTIAADRGLPAVDAGLLLAWLSIIGIPAALLTPVVAARLQNRAAVFLAISALSAVGMAALAFAPISFAVLSVAAIGIAQSAAFGLAVWLIVARSPSSSRTSSFSAVAQGFGYIFAALGPFAAGLLADASGGWTGVVAILAGVALVQGVFGVLASPRGAGPLGRREPRDA